MRAPATRTPTRLAAALSTTLWASASMAQELPPPPPPAPTTAPATAPTNLLARSVEPAMDEGLRLAVHLLRTRQTEDAVAVLARMVQERGVDVRGYDPVAVLFRLANGRARPGLPTGGALPLGAPPPAAPPAPEGEDLPPPPPSDEVVRARVIDGLVERLARWDEAGARSFLESAATEASFAGPEGATLRALRLLTRGGVSTVGALSGGYATNGLFAPTSRYASNLLLPDRPAGTIEGLEVLTLYVSMASYGLILGTWGGLAATHDNRNALRVALPLTGITAGIVGAILLDRSRSVRRGRGYAFNSGLVLGTLAGTAAVIYADPDDPVDGWGWALGATTLGIGAALGISHLVDALPGSVNYVTSAGLWGSMVGLSLSLAVDGDHTRGQTLASGMLIGEGVGVVLAMLSADALKPTPSQTRWADVGACVGGMLGASLGAGAGSLQGVGVGTAIGILTGGALAWFAAMPGEADRSTYLQRNAARELPLRFGVAPVPGGAMLHVGM
jgi:hypothetical protein